MIARSSWVRGILFGAMGLVLAVVATRDALVQNAARGRPDFVLRLDPTNATALNTQFRNELEGQPGAPPAPPPALGDWAARARASLRAAPLSAAMVRMVSADPAQSPKQAEATLHLAERLSRRDVLTQLALIETAVNAGQVDTALRHYDHALSIYPDMRTILFPLLANGMAEPDIQRGIVALARRQRPWIAPFFAFAVQSSSAPQAVAATLATLDHGPQALGDARAHEAALANRLAATGDYALARRVAMRAAGTDAAAIDRAGFSAATWGQPTRPLTWSATEDDSIDAQLQGDDQLAISVLPGRAGLAIFRMLVRTPGAYRFTAHAAAPADLTATGGRWGILCLQAGGKTGPSLADIPVAAGKSTSTALISIPAACAAVRVAFSIDNVNGSSDAGILLRDIALSPAR